MPFSRWSIVLGLADSFFLARLITKPLLMCGQRTRFDGPFLCRVLVRHAFSHFGWFFSRVFRICFSFLRFSWAFSPREVFGPCLRPSGRGFLRRLVILPCVVLEPLVVIEPLSLEIDVRGHGRFGLPRKRVRSGSACGKEQACGRGKGQGAGHTARHGLREKLHICRIIIVPGRSSTWQAAPRGR